MQLPESEAQCNCNIYTTNCNKLNLHNLSYSYLFLWLILWWSGIFQTCAVYTLDYLAILKSWCNEILYMHAYVIMFLKESFISLLHDALFICSIISVGSHHACGYWFNQSVLWPNHYAITGFEWTNNYKGRNTLVISNCAMIQAYGLN